MIIKINLNIISYYNEHFKQLSSLYIVILTVVEVKRYICLTFKLPS